MKAFLLLSALFSSFLFLNPAQAQTKVTKGDMSWLKDQKQVTIEYSYEGMRVGKYKKEADYVDRKVKDYNKKEAGRGDIWKEAWENDREAYFQPKFEELVNKYIKKSEVYMSAEGTEDAEYKMVVRTTFTEPGFNVYVARKNAMIDLEIKFYKKSDPTKVIATAVAKRAQGRTFGGNDYDTATRLSEAYAKAGKDFGKYLFKKYLK